MKLGSKGVQIAELQADLTKAGYSPGPADGVFGPATDKAVRAFQAANKLKVDGIVSPATQAALTAKVNIKSHQAQDKPLSANFNEREFACRHCGQVYVEPAMVERLQVLRQALGKPIKVTSGYRCPTHNKNVGGATQSRHMQGQAADITVDGMSPLQVSQAADKVGFGGIGIYLKSGFTHCDIGPHRRWRD